MQACLNNELSLAQRIMNFMIVESLGVAPFNILFGNAIDLGRGIFLPPMTKANVEMKRKKFDSRHAG